MALLAHAFGQRYELPIPLALFVFGGATVVFLSFLFVLPMQVHGRPTSATAETIPKRYRHGVLSYVSFLLFAAFLLCGLLGSQVVAENIVPTLFWLVIWIAVPISCGVLGDWTRWLNPFANAAMLMNAATLRRLLLGREQPFNWPRWIGWWPAAVGFFILACGELVYNQIATIPMYIAAFLLLYFLLNGFMGLVFGYAWITYGEVFSVLFSTWGRLGYFRFGADGRRGMAGGTDVPFDPSPSRITFTLLLLISVSFDGLLSTPIWSNFQHWVSFQLSVSQLEYQLIATGIFVLLALAIWLVFHVFATGVRWAAGYTHSARRVLAELLPSLLPISFGYLLAHNIEYLIVNGQLLFPLIGNPAGNNLWPLHLPYPFNDSFEPNIHLLPSAAYWYFSVAVIVGVHIVAVVQAHRHLASATLNHVKARRSEYPWIAAMVLYTMFSLWLLAQPLVKEKQMAQTNTISIRQLAVSPQVH